MHSGFSFSSEDQYVGEKTRHHCLNPKCRCKLPTPVSNAEAFCCRGQLQAVAAFADFVPSVELRNQNVKQ
jgi:hypothetical protein